MSIKCLTFFNSCYIERYYGFGPVYPDSFLSLTVKITYCVDIQVTHCPPVRYADDVHYSPPDCPAFA